MRFSNRLLAREKKHNDRSGNMEINCLKLLLDRWQGQFTDEVFNEIVVSLLRGDALLFLAARAEQLNQPNEYPQAPGDDLLMIQNQVRDRSLNVFVDFDSISSTYGDSIFLCKPMRALDIVNAVEENNIRKIRIHHGQEQPFEIKWTKKHNLLT